MKNKRELTEDDYLLISRGHTFEDNYHRLVDLNSDFQDNEKIDKMWNVYLEGKHTIKKLDSWNEYLLNLINKEEEKIEDDERYCDNYIRDCAPYGDIWAQV
ncbi:MAG: hypothetical protein HWN81_11995 [Candidatus Lokiarchaeota archaeon]|nr:hypothetical protein [Candidatus Lokiarchaeota archaeon]